MAPTDRTSTVADVKAQLVARGADLSGPDGAFEITKRVAWALRAEGAGLLSKTTGNNSHGFAVDIVAYQDGTYVDMLVDAGGANTPIWQVAADRIDVTRWFAPSDPGDDAPLPVPVPSPVPVPLPVGDVLATIFGQVHELVEPLVAALQENTLALNRTSDKLAEAEQRGFKLHF